MAFKTITIKKRGGGTRKQKVKVLSSGKFKFVKNSTKSTSKRRTTKRKSTTRRVKRVIRKASPRRIMARRRRSTRRSAPRKQGFLKGLPIISNPMFKKAAAGVGTATLAVSLLSLVAPSIAQQPLVKPALALAGGDFIGLGAQVLTGGGLGGILGGNGNNMEGFA